MNEILGWSSQEKQTKKFEIKKSETELPSEENLKAKTDTKR